LRPSFCLIALLVLSLASSRPVGAAPSARPTAPVSYEGNFLKTLSRAPEAPSEWHPLQDKYGRFAIAVPADWTEGSAPPDQESMMYALVAGEIQGHDNFNANLVVSQTQAPPDFHMKASMVAPLAAQMARSMKAYHYVIKDKAFTTVDHVPCVIIGGTLEVDQRELRNLQVRLVHRGVNYLFTFTALDKYYGQYEPLFARLVKSIVFEREGGLPSPVPSPRPSAVPSTHPSAVPSPHPSAVPSAHPAAVPSAHPSATPSAHPSATPSPGR
jgi:hypothetical protein